MDFQSKIFVFYTTVLHLDLKGLNSLVNLEELNLADNAIETLGRFIVKHHILAIVAF